jgi:Uma2 family endonuclease
MPATAEQPAVPQQRRFTVDEYYRMAEAGVFAPDDRIELLDGRIYAMSPISSEHAACVRRLTRLLIQGVGTNAIVSTQNPVRIDQNSESEPDVSLLHPRDDDYASRHPQPSDVLLVVEVAETSLEFDRTVKGSLYAQAGIPALWIANLEAGRIEVIVRLGRTDTPRTATTSVDSPSRSSPSRHLTPLPSRTCSATRND